MDSKNRQRNTPLILMILDGFGLADPKNTGNAITPKTAPHIFGYMKKYPSTTLIAHGKDVGLFPDQQGNSEAGHLNIGAGRVVEQDLVMISRAITDGTFFKNEAFREGVRHAKTYGSAVHVMGLLTNHESAHARDEHLFALLEFLRREKCPNVFLHLFTDGRDTSPHAAIHLLRALRKRMKNNETIATISGRFYAMDRNKLWERTQRVYEAMVLGKGRTAKTAEEAIEEAYNCNESDEYIVPTVIVNAKQKPVGTIHDHDVLYFFNARSDRARQLAKAFVQPDFQKINPEAFSRRRIPKDIRFVAMTDFGPDLPGIITAFPSPNITNPLAKAIGDHFRQLFISETEKYAHVTYFLNGGYAEAVNGETRELVRSSNVYSYAKKPEMQSKKVADRVIDAINKGTYDVIVINFPNADMVGHTGDLLAAKKAVSFLDAEVAKVVDAVQKRKGVVIITADHGNAEAMVNRKTGEMMTEHTTNPVPFILVSSLFKKRRLKKGRLADVAPTILKLLGVKKPKEMRGKPLM